MSNDTFYLWLQERAQQAQETTEGRHNYDEEFYRAQGYVSACEDILEVYSEKKLNSSLW